MTRSLATPWRIFGSPSLSSSVSWATTWASMPAASASPGSSMAEASATSIRAAATSSPRCCLRAWGSCQSMSGFAPRNPTVAADVASLRRPAAALTAWRRNPRMSS